MDIVALAGFALLVTFLVTVVTRRAAAATALVVGTLVAMLAALATLPAFAEARTCLGLLWTWGACGMGGLVGAWLARLVHAWWRRA